MASADDFPPCPPLSGLILAGGAGRRVDGEDKAWLEWQGRPLFEHTLERLQPQVGPLWVSANRELVRYQPWLADGRLAGLLPDDWPDMPGPLAGLAASLPRIAASTPPSPWVLVTPVDTPRLPLDLGRQLWQGLRQAEQDRAEPASLLAVARQQGQTHWLHLLVHVSAAAGLHERLRQGERRVQDWCRALQAVTVDIDAEAPAFANLNRWQDFDELHLP